MELLATSILYRTSATKCHPGGCKIRDKILYCSEFFKQAPAGDSGIQDAHKRFQAWHTNYTAGRAATPSLDEHLRDAPDFRAATLESLEDLVTAFKCRANSSVDRALMHKAVESLEHISICLEIPASVDWYEKAKYVNVDHFIPIDKSHIDELFPKADPVLRDRLLQGVLSRRRALRYVQEHKEELAKEAPCPQDEEGDENEISDCDDDETASDMSVSSSLCSDMSIRVPPMPPTRQEGKPFECSYCCSMIEAENREEWKRHVSSDMLPYVCTFTDCEEPGRLFESRCEWYVHELNHHRRTWFCIRGCLEKFDSKSAFEAHLRVAHGELGGVARAEELGAHSTRLPEPETSMCPMCGDEIQDPELVMVHIGRHQAQLGLWTLRSMGYFYDEDDQEGYEEYEEDGAEMSDDDDKVPGNPAPSQDAAGSDSPPPGSTETWPSFDRESYKVGWICASPDDLAAAVACLDARHKAVQPIPEDGSYYEFGEINGHRIVIWCYGADENRQASVAWLAAQMPYNFPGVKVYVSVGIGARVPSRHANIRLGDVVVGSSGTMHFGMGQDGLLELQSRSNLPPRLLRSTLQTLLADSETGRFKLEGDIQSILDKNPRLRDDYSRPDSSSDNGGRPAVGRSGLIVSSTTMLTNDNCQKVVANKEEIVCFESEGTEISALDCLLIRGICEYGDSHKDKQSQRYAAMSAAVYARALLGCTPSTMIK
ncbi:Zinc finger, C2H2-like protein [Metarhizium brunneum]